jgi:hypothetical protein
MESVLVTLKNSSWIRFDMFGAMCRVTRRPGTEFWCTHWKLLANIPPGDIAWIEHAKPSGEVVIVPVLK